jgi:hypothetical protein
MTVMDGGGAMRVGEGARNAKQEWRDGERASAALERKPKERRGANTKCEGKNPLRLPLGFIAPRAVLSEARAPRTLTAGKNFSR